MCEQDHELMGAEAGNETLEMLAILREMQNISRNISQHGQSDWLDSFRFNLDHIVLPIVFTIGIIGNVLNLAIFCRQKIRRGMEQIERSATAGLVALALSDLLFCIVGLPAVIFSQYSGGSGNGTLVLIAFSYMMYRGALMNIFLFSSTWIIVLIALERYLAVCWPFKARCVIRVKRTVTLHSIVFIVSIVLNIPLFMKYSLGKIPCGDGCQCYTWMPGFYFQHETFAYVHRIIWAILGIFIPLVALLFANCCLIKELYITRTVTDDGRRCASSRTTITLMAIVFLFLFLVCPSMVLEFLQTHFHVQSLTSNLTAYRVAIMVTNLTQAIKFSCNFLLYCVLNKQFRRKLGRSRCVTYKAAEESRRSSETSNRYHLVAVRL